MTSNLILKACKKQMFLRVVKPNILCLCSISISVSLVARALQKQRNPGKIYLPTLSTFYALCNSPICIDL